MKFIVAAGPEPQGAGWTGRSVCNARVAGRLTLFPGQLEQNGQVTAYAVCRRHVRQALE